MTVPLSAATSRRVYRCIQPGPGITVPVVLCYAVVCMIIDRRVMQDKAQCASVDCFAVSAAGSRIVVSLQTARPCKKISCVCVSVSSAFCFVFLWFSMGSLCITSLIHFLYVVVVVSHIVDGWLLHSQNASELSPDASKFVKWLR